MRPPRQDPRRQAVKDKLARGDRVRLVNPMYGSAALMEFLSRRFDIVFFDCEHRGFDFETIDDLARGVRAGAGVSIVRPWSKEPGLLARFIHCGVDGLFLPQIRSRAELQDVVDLMVEVRPAEASSLVLLALIESVEGAENLDGILAVPGLDGVVVGSHDLAVSMGLPRHSDDPRVSELAIEIVRKARAAGKSASALSQVGAEGLRRAGANITLTDVNTLLRQATAALED